MNQKIINGRVIQVREERDLSIPREKKSYRRKTSRGKPSRRPQQAKSKARRTAGEAGHQGQDNGGPMMPPNDSRNQSSEVPSRTVYVSNISWTSTDDDLFQHFCSIGATPVSASVALGIYTHHSIGVLAPFSRGWGLVEFSTVEAAATAIAHLHNSSLDGRRINVRFDIPAPPDMQENFPPHSMPQHHMHHAHHHMFHHHHHDMQPYMHVPHCHAPVEQAQVYY